MMPNSYDYDSPFSKLIKSQFDIEKQRVLSLEATLVNFIIKELSNSPVNIKKLITNHAMQHFGTPILNFSSFMTCYPRFPVFLRFSDIKNIHTDPSCFLPNLMKNFEKSKIYKEFINNYDDYKGTLNDKNWDKSSFGLIIRRKGIRYGLICHNSEDDIFKINCFFTYKNARCKKPILLQPTKDFILALKENGFRLENMRSTEYF